LNNNTIPPEVIIRERRLHSILNYHGNAADLAKRSSSCSLKCMDNSFNQCGDCSAQRATLPIAQILDSVLINHAPIGCAGDFSIFNGQYRRGLRYREMDVHNINAISTNLGVSDTVYGGAAKLEAAIRKAQDMYHPKAIFVTTSCASGIIGDDIEDIISSMEEEIGTPIIPIYCEGFKSKIWTTGFDAAFHGILRKIVKPPEKKEPNIINIFNFTNEMAFTPFLAKIGLKPRYFAQHASIEELAKLSEAAATAHICETLGTYIAHELEERYGIPEMKSPPPYGLEWSDKWLREAGRITGREALVEEVIASERKRIAPELESLKAKLSGTKVFVMAGASFGHNLFSLARDFGMIPVGMSGFHHDQHFDGGAEGISSIDNLVGLFGDIENYNVCNKQPYQVVNILRKSGAELLLARHDTMPIVGVKLGIPTFFSNDANLQIGYDGVIYTGRMILRVLQGKNFAKNIAKHAEFPYTAWWIEQDPFYFEWTDNHE